MAIEAHIAADSVNPAGNRLTTWVLKYPRSIHSELMTHRVFSRNSASSRAIPISKMIQRVIDDPFVPHWWGKAQPGMQAYEEIDDKKKQLAVKLWLKARDQTLEVIRGFGDASSEGAEAADNLLSLGLHKQVVNRLLEPWMHIEIVLSATEWNNWFLLRDEAAAEPHIRELAHTMRQMYLAHEPVLKSGLPGGCRMTSEGVLQTSGQSAAWEQFWHVPFGSLDQNVVGAPAVMNRIKESIAHCAWVSYLNEWRQGYTQADVDRVYDSLLSAQPIHASPAEHVAVACDGPHRHGNFTGWCQWRKFLPGESGGDYS